jgi:protein SCO1/2
VIISFAFSGCIGTEEIAVEYNGTEYRNPVEVPDFSLTDQDGNQVNLSDYQGKVVVVAFIFTSCPDVCPAIEHTLNYVDYLLPDHGIENDVEFISITIDPARDTVETLKNYTTANSFDWPHLTSSNPDDLVEVWSDWNIVVDNDHIYSDHSNHSSHDSHDSHNSNETSNNSGNESDEDGHEGHGDHSSDSGQDDSADSDTEYNVGHSTVTFILDQDGNKRVSWSGYDWDAELFLEDLVTMVYGSNQDSDDHAAHAHH